MPSSIKGAYVGNDKLYPMSVSGDTLTFNGTRYAKGLKGQTGKIVPGKGSDLFIQTDDNGNSYYVYNFPVYEPYLSDSGVKFDSNSNLPVNISDSLNNTYKILADITDDQNQVFVLVVVHYTETNTSDPTAASWNWNICWLDYNSITGGK